MKAINVLSQITLIIGLVLIGAYFGDRRAHSITQNKTIEIVGIAMTIISILAIIAVSLPSNNRQK
ncbi:hypothetical protein [Mucilaginibacter pineti]|uniref:hypothetical protein n=1 Tax=Mucilaginibacter pineti TaxID=1391627 RepID=UPI000B838448|nr:hypothetical protein [Mucilaginibacter pineti]